MQIEEDWQLVKRKVARIREEAEKLRMSPALVTMLIAAEDHRFGKHPGVDPVAICRAVWRSFFCGRKEGASTIAMQLVRVLTGRYERTFKRKLVEMFLALRLTKHIPETDIPKLYLLVAYFGWGMNGLVQAANRLEMDLFAMTKIEAASIIARLKYPEPKRHDEIRLAKIRARIKHIVSRFNLLVDKKQSIPLKLGDVDGAI